MKAHECSYKGALDKCMDWAYDLVKGNSRMPRVAWLIEDRLGELNPSVPSYFRLFGIGRETPKPEWTTDPNCAMAFARKSDAQWMMLLYPSFCVCAVATEHGFIDKE